MNRLSLAVIALTTLVGPARAQTYMVVLDRTSVKPGEKVTATLLCGRPFVGDRVSAESPIEATMYPPTVASGTLDLLGAMEKVSVAEVDRKPVTGYRFTVEPKQPGDYTLTFQCPPLWQEERERFVQDAIRVNLHVQKEGGWAQNVQGPFAFVPMTRPYGLREGALFQARLSPERPERSHLVELERYSAEPPKELPEPEFVTTRFRTDDRGVASCILHERGWWVLTADHSPLAMTITPRRKRGDKDYPLVQRAVLMVYLEGEPAKKGQR